MHLALMERDIGAVVGAGGDVAAVRINNETYVRTAPHDNLPQNVTLEKGCSHLTIALLD